MNLANFQCFATIICDIFVRFDCEIFPPWFCVENDCFSNFANMYPHVIICRSNVWKFVPVLVKINFLEFSTQIVRFMSILYQIMQISWFFGKISRISQVFGVFCMKNTWIVIFMAKIPSIWGLRMNFFCKISILVSEYPNFSDFSPPITDCNPKIIRFYRFFRVIDS